MGHFLERQRLKAVSTLINKTGILFLYPKDLYWSWPVSNDFCRKILPLLRVTYPQLASMIPEIPVTFIDCMANLSIGFEEYIKILEQYPVICISSVTPLAALNTEITVRLIKKHNPDAVVVLGGHHATFYSEEWLQRGVDIIVRHEGEIAFQSVMRALASGQPIDGIQGISFIGHEGTPVHTDDAPFVDNLDDLPIPNWDIVDFSLYSFRLTPNGPPGTVETSRGCPHKCNFCCAAAMWKHRQRFKSAERVLAEIDNLVQRGVGQIMFADDNFGVRRKRDIEILEGVISRSYDLGIWSFIRASTVLKDPDFIEIAARAGLKQVYIGYEAIKDGTLDHYKKNPHGVNAADYTKVYQTLHKNGIFVVGMFVRDFDPDEEAQASIWEWMRVGRICDASAQSQFIPMRGTPGYDELTGKGYCLKDMFYHDRFMPAYEYKGTTQSFKCAITSMYELIKPSNFVKLLFGNFVEKTFFRTLYGGIFYDLFHVDILNLKVWWVILHKKYSLDQKQNLIVRMYMHKYCPEANLKKI